MERDIKAIVREILKKYPETRDSDKELLLTYYLYYSTYKHVETFIIEDFDFISKFIRYRAEIQNKEGLYKATEEIQKKRNVMKKEKTVEFTDYQNRVVYVTKWWIKKFWSKIRVFGVWK